jgi:hypothetical protein
LHDTKVDQSITPKSTYEAQKITKTNHAKNEAFAHLHLIQRIASTQEVNFHNKLRNEHRGERQKLPQLGLAEWKQER